MLNMYAFDCDGCLDRSFGPIPVEMLLNLKAMGHVVVVVSPSVLCANPRIPGIEYINESDRLTNLLEAKRRHPNCQYYYYFTDNPGEELLEEPSGFTVIKVV